jgi:branched-chain amino acid transport system permease protein
MAEPARRTASGFAAGRKRLVLLAGLAILLLLPPLTALAGESYLVSLFTRILIYGLAAASLDLILGYGAMVSLGHAAFFGAGAYVVGILAFHAADNSPVFHWALLPAGTDAALAAWPLAVLAAALLALVIGALSLRTSGMHFIMITLAFAQMLYYFFVSLPDYGGSDGLSLWWRSRAPGVDLADDTHFYYLCLALLLAFLYLGRRVVNSRFGMVIRGCRQNEARLRAIGIPTYRYKLACFVLAGAGAGLAGALAANQTEFVSPDLLHWTRSGEILVMVLLGGMGTLVGPVFGAATLLLAEEVISGYTEHWQVFLGPFLVVVVLFARHGVYGLLAGREARDG